MLVVVSIVLFALAAVGGVVIVVLYQRGTLLLPLALVHGALAAAGLIVLILAAAQGQTTAWGNVALGLFVVAALGGLYLIYSHLTGKRLPQAIIGVHATVAVVAFLLLLLGGIRPDTSSGEGTHVHDDAEAQHDVR